ncbi:alkaline phosphatase family protein [Anaerocolumna sp. MB42-C2]|uniref:alkaline phosphatase family protein n=1 Tax=Anaerocolumna sp. MB42-C2 TaxID=3070997 RepID=UPI0027E0247B|nr:ectonucleotide pyrophosphatase/phosphodiesterase [Anaerocolumna sp. MB42-C2]WMJ86909.1 ectonucleotide pyrophosphatase/phosphodiesterase [Anaerocolumna sp. MB42-C2]
METGKAKYLMVISYDAFSEDNWEKASKLPNLLKLIKNGAYTTKLKSVYPTLTYVVHTTMVTGVYPDKHGIYHNNPIQPFVREQEQNWFWFKKDIKVPAIYDVLQKYHMKSAGILWPVTGKAAISYNIPEIRAIKQENQALKILRNGSPLYSIRMEKKFGRLRKGIKQPNLDNFTTMCAMDTIKREKPNLLLVHLIDLDDTKHEYGTDSPEIEKVLIRMDKRLGDILKAAEEAGIKKDTVFLIVGDHGQINVRYKIKLNYLLKENGLIYEENGQMKWRAYIQNAGGAAYLFLKDKDIEAEQLALKVLKDAITDESYGIERLYTGKELAAFHVEPSIKYMLEAKAGFCFDDSLKGPVITDLKAEGVKYATHGFSPDKPGYKCNLVISGDCIKNEFQLGEIQMVDLAPTMANILGIHFADCDGRSLNEIFQPKG